MTSQTETGNKCEVCGHYAWSPNSPDYHMRTAHPTVARYATYINMGALCLCKSELREHRSTSAQCPNDFGHTFRPAEA